MAAETLNRRRLVLDADKAVVVGCLGRLGAGIGYTTASCKICWGITLMIAGSLLTGLGYLLQVV